MEQKISNLSIKLIKKIMQENNISEFNQKTCEDILEYLDCRISGLVTDIEDNHNSSQTNLQLLENLDQVSDELSNIDFNDEICKHINNRISEIE